MYSIITISDVHGTTNWKQMVTLAKNGDKIIFLGDYFDHRGHGHFAESQTDNFLEICAYARKNPDVTLLIGNHDFNYMPWAKDVDNYDPHAREYQDAIMDNISLLQMVTLNRDFPRPVLFSHGGVTNTFLKIHGLQSPNEINSLWIKHPESFDWLPANPETGTWSDMYGDDPWQPPIWVRNEALESDGVIGYDQVVGHTPVRTPFVFTTQYGDRVLMTCTLDDQEIILHPDKRIE